jgi:hypothetical protein
MTNPRDDVRFDGIGYKTQTYKIDNSTITYEANQPNGTSKAGLALTLNANKTVALAGDGEGVLGKLIAVEPDDKAVVQTEGYASLPGGEGATLSLMTAIVGDLGPSNAKGYIRSVATATAAELGRCHGMIVDASDTTEVWVKL